MLKVLEVFREPLAGGGQESFIMNMYRNMDHDQIIMDFMTPFVCANEDMKEEIESYGGRVYAYGRPFGPADNRAFNECLENFLADHHYPIVHFHSGSTYALMKGPQLAKKAGIPVRIVHSHCTGMNDFKYQAVKLLSIPYFHRYATDFAACSNKAARWKFPNKIISNKNYTVFKNAVDLDQFAWNPQIRKEVRKELGIDEDQIVIGHLGRFSAQKNHVYLIEIFETFLRSNPDAVLLMAGEGELESDIRKLVKEKGIESRVRFLGFRKDSNRLMNAMDLFVLPSLFEGLPVVAVEAQANGLPVLTSTEVTRELPVDNLSFYLPLGSSNVDAWIYAMQAALKIPRKNTGETLKKAGYDVHEAADRLMAYYKSRAVKDEDRV